MAAFGLAETDFPPPADLVIWPENRHAVSVFCALSTQWRLAQGVGYTGLDYNVIPTVMRLRAVPAAERSAVFDQIRAMEREVLRLQRTRH